MICPFCDNPGVDIIPFPDVHQAQAVSPIFVIAPDCLWCPCGCIFEWRSRVIIQSAPEGVIEQWWLAQPKDMLVGGIPDLTDTQRAALQNIVNMNCIVAPYGDHRYFWLYLSPDMPAYSVASILDSVQLFFQSWQWKNDPARITFLVKYR